jgi:hypothetical protein
MGLFQYNLPTYSYESPIYITCLVNGMSIHYSVHSQDEKTLLKGVCIHKIVEK